MVLAGATLPLCSHPLRREVGDLGSQRGALHHDTVGSLLGGCRRLCSADLPTASRVPDRSGALVRPRRSSRCNSCRGSAYGGGVRDRGSPRSLRSRAAAVLPIASRSARQPRLRSAGPRAAGLTRTCRLRYDPNHRGGQRREERRRWSSLSILISEIRGKHRGRYSTTALLGWCGRSPRTSAARVLAVSSRAHRR